MKIGFDNEKYLKMQSEHIRERIGQFGNKLYLEFGGKLFDDYHASRVLPGFEPDSKFRMLKSIADDVEVIIAINANHIEKNKARGDLGITYDEDVLRLVEGGVPIKKVNIGNMHMAEGKRQVATSVAVDDNDVATFKKLQDLGVELEIQRVPQTGVEDLSKLWK